MVKEELNELENAQPQEEPAEMPVSDSEASVDEPVVSSSDEESVAVSSKQEVEDDDEESEPMDDDKAGDDDAEDRQHGEATANAQGGEGQPVVGYRRQQFRRRRHRAERRYGRGSITANAGAASTPEADRDAKRQQSSAQEGGSFRNERVRRKSVHDQ